MSVNNFLLNIHEAMQNILSLCISGVDWSDSPSQLALKKFRMAFSADLPSATSEYEFLVKLVKSQQAHVKALQALNEATIRYNEVMRLDEAGNATIEPETVKAAELDYRHWLAVEKMSNQEVQAVCKEAPHSLSIEPTLLQ